jgi:hypothetical protein
MIDKMGEPNKGDYSREIMSFPVRVILSALSHFWFIIIAICIGMLFWVTIVLLGQLMRSVAGMIPWLSHARQTNNSNKSDFGSQVFIPSKIRRSMDC